jgi:hypothetical protein
VFVSPVCGNTRVLIGVPGLLCRGEIAVRLDTAVLPESLRGRLFIIGRQRFA